MPKVHWLDVPLTPSYRRVTGVIPPGELADALYSSDLKASLNLVARACSRLHLRGRYAFQAARSPRLEVRAAFESTKDAEAFGVLVGLVPPFPVDSSFLFDAPNSARLEEIAGPADHRGAGRRARERAARQNSLSL